MAQIFGHHLVVLLLIVHLLLGLARLPDVATISRALASTDAQGVLGLRALVRDFCLDRLRRLGLSRLTLDFDGSVLSTGRSAEGTAVGFNKKKRGARSYYPLFCTIAQTGQVLDVLHRPGSVHDSRGAREFILACLGAVHEALPWVRLEVRMDSAFFGDEIVRMLDEQGVEFTISVPFERLVDLKRRIEAKRRWKYFDCETAYFELRWKPKKWKWRHRLLHAVGLPGAQHAEAHADPTSRSADKTKQPPHPHHVGQPCRPRRTPRHPGCPTSRGLTRSRRTDCNVRVDRPGSSTWRNDHRHRALP